MNNSSNNIWQVLKGLPEQDVQQQPLCEDHTVGLEECTVGPESHRLCVGTDTHHTSIPVIPSLLGLILLQIGLLTAVFILPVFYETLPASTNAFSVLQYIFVICWALIALLNWHVYVEFKRLWLLGYHSFHNSTKHLHAISFFVYTAGLMLMCILGTAVRDYCTVDAITACGKHIHLSPVNYQQIIVVLLTLIALLLNVKLIGDVYRFNESDLPADVLVDDLGVRLSQSTLYVGIGRPSSIHTVLEVQGATIGSLRHRVDTLNKQIVVLANALEGYLEVVE